MSEAAATAVTKSSAPKPATAPALGGWGGWLAFAAALVLLPLVLRSGGTLSILSLMGVAIVFALSYNMLLGQTGML